MKRTISTTIFRFDFTDMRFFLYMAFDGTPFHGWQIQPEHITVQGTVEKCLSLLLHRPHIGLTGCGRTDAGVSATAYYAHFDTTQILSQSECISLKDQLNNFLPPEIAIHDIFAVRDDAHARFDAQSRTYRYFIATKKNPFTDPHRRLCRLPLDIDAMNGAATLLLHTEDFTSFSKVNTEVRNFVCHVTEAHWQYEDDDLVFTITANRFLRNMVRAIVGTLIEVGKGKITVDDFQNIIYQKNRSKAGTSMPARALFLTNVRYAWEQIRLEKNDF